VGKLEREHQITLGFVDLLHDDYTGKIPKLWFLFHPRIGFFPRCYICIHVWHMPAITINFGDDSILQFGGGTFGHPWGMH